MIDSRRLARRLLSPEDQELVGGYSPNPEIIDRASLLPIGQYEDGSLTLAWPGFLKDAFEGAARTYLDAGNVPVPDAAPGTKWASNLDGFNASGIVPVGAFGARALGLTKDVGDLGMFAGKAARTAHHGKLAQAESMAASGAPREQIWNDTGWFQGVDKKWRFEIDDSPATFSGVPGATTVLGDALGHPGMFGAYPDTMRIPLTVEKPGRAVQGSFNGDGITVSSADGLSTAIHELQHGVQGIEGFAAGGNPALFYMEKAKAAAKPFEDELGSLKEKFNQIQAEWSGLNNDNSTFGMLGQRKEWARKRLDELHAESAGLTGRMSDVRRARRRAEQEAWAAMNLTSPEAFDYYRRLAGEAEARTVEARRTFTPADRANRPPWLDYDVPEEDQIVRFLANDANASLPSLLGAEQDDNDPMSILQRYGLLEPPAEDVPRPPVIGPGRPDPFDRYNDPFFEVPEIINNPFSDPPRPPLPRLRRPLPFRLGPPTG